MSKVKQSKSSYLQAASRDPAARAYFASAAIQLQVSQLMADAFADSGLTKSELAKRMDVSRARVSQILDGEPQNFTLDLVGRAAGALGLVWRISLDDYWSGEAKFTLESSPVGNPPLALLQGYTQLPNAEPRERIDRSQTLAVPVLPSASAFTHPWSSGSEVVDKQGDVSTVLRRVS